MTTQHSKVQMSNGILIAYSGLAAPLSIAELPIVLYLPAFYAKEVGLNIGLVGLVFLLARLWDGVTDPLIGWLSDSAKSRHGRRKPWVLTGAPLLVLASWFLCNPPDTVGVLYLGVWAALFYIAWTLVRIPYWSWGTELSTDYNERSKVTAFREGGSMIGSLIAVSAPLLLLSRDAPIRDVLFLISMSIIILVPLTVLPLGLYVNDALSPHKQEAINFLDGLRALRQNKPLIRFIIATGLLFLVLGILNSMGIFLVEVAFGLPGSIYSLIVIEYITAICIAPLIVRLAGRFGKHIVLSAGIGALFCTLLYGLILPQENYPAAAIQFFMLGIAFSCIFVLPTSILADIIDYDTAATGVVRSGTYVAVYNLVTKFGLAAGVGLSFGLLEMFGYDSSASVHNALDITHLKVVGFGIPAVLSVPFILLMMKFPIDRKAQQQLRRDIEKNLANSEPFKKESLEATAHKIPFKDLLPE